MTAAHIARAEPEALEAGQQREVDGAADGDITDARLRIVDRRAAVLDGTPWNYLDVWSHGPDNFMGNQDCLFIWQNGDGASPADDEFCAEAHPFICKAPGRSAPRP